MSRIQNEDTTGRQLPTILIVCGAWHVPDHYKPLILELESRGFTVDCPRLPTSSGIIPPTAGAKDDADFIRKIAVQHLEQGHSLIPLLHSYGGTIGTRAFSGLGKNEKAVSEFKGASVLHIIYLSAFAPPENDLPVNPMSQSAPVPYLDFSTTETDGMVRLKEDLIPEYFYGDLSPEQVGHAISLIVPLPVTVLGQMMAGTSPLVPAYKTISTTYVVTEQDKAFPAPVQETMVQRIEQETGDGVHTQTVKMNCSHSPCVSMPKELANIIEDRVEAVLDSTREGTPQRREAL